MDTRKYIVLDTFIDDRTLYADKQNLFTNFKLVNSKYTQMCMNGMPNELYRVCVSSSMINNTKNNSWKSIADNFITKLILSSTGSVMQAQIHF